MSRFAAIVLIVPHKSTRPPAHLRRRAPGSQGSNLCLSPIEKLHELGFLKLLDDPAVGANHRAAEHQAQGQRRDEVQ